MAIKSYLVHPHLGQKETLQKELSSIKNCDVIPAENKDVMILVTESNSRQEEEIIKEKLDAISSIKLLAMVSGFNTKNQ